MFFDDVMGRWSVVSAYHINTTNLRCQRYVVRLTVARLTNHSGKVNTKLDKQRQGAALTTNISIVIQTKSNPIQTSKMTTTETTKPNNEIQRIYIGGIQPPTLTVEMVQKRLESTLSNQIDFLSFDIQKSTNAWGEDAQTFFFATVQSRPVVSSSSSSQDNAADDALLLPPPIDVITKQYNNVKWKGCTLRIQKAKLHLLQRLEIERKEAEQARLKKIEGEALLKEQEAELKFQLTKQTNTNTNTNTTPTSTSTSTPVPVPVNKTKRHLRIKKRFGEEAYIVDTKPVKTGNQKDLHLALKKQREKRAKHLDIWIQSRKKRKSQVLDIEQLKKEEANFSLQSKVFLNRAIHIHFGDDADVSMATARIHNGGGGVRSSIIYSDDEDCPNDNTVRNLPRSTTTSAVSDDESSVPSSSSEEESDDKKEGYDWSDGSDDEATEHANVEARKGDGDMVVSSEKSEMPNESNGTSVKEVEVLPATTNDMKEMVHEKEPDASDDSDDQTKGYAWSDSEDDGDSDDDNQEKKRFDYNESKHDDLDEFASNFNDNVNTSWKYGEEDFAGDDDADFQDVYLSLEVDVKSNLGVIAKLFPELSNKTPESFNETGAQAKPQAPAGWDSFGLMQRYDPTAASAVAYEVKPEEPVEDSDEDASEEEVTVEANKEGASEEEVESSENEVSSEEEEVSSEEIEPDDELKKLEEPSRPAASDSSDDESQESAPASEIVADKGASEDEDVNDGTVNNDKPTDANEEKQTTTIIDTKEQVYEQKKLENIFQQERTGKGTTGFQMSSLFDQSVISTSAPSPVDKGFSFSFQADPQTLETKVDTAEMETENGNATMNATQQKITREIMDNTQPDLPKLKKRRGLTFSKEELEVYTTKFFNANQGIDAILASMKDPKRSEADQRKWMEEERTVLTLDWKRKQKYGQSQRKKKFKFR